MKENQCKKFCFRRSAVFSSLLVLSVLSSGTRIPVAAKSAAAIPGKSGEQTDIKDLKALITADKITENGVSVKAYQIVDGYYNSDHQFSDYVLMDPVNAPITDIEDPRPDELTKIADNIASGAFTADAGTVMTKGTDGKYTASVEPGMYIVLVTGAEKTVYNPGLVSVNVKDAYLESKGSLEAGAIDYSGAAELPGGTAVWMKSSESTMVKTIVDSSKKENGDTVSYGAPIQFEIGQMTIPSFSEDYDDPHYYITDELDDTAFEEITDLEVRVDGKELLPQTGSGEQGSTNYTITTKDGKTAVSDLSKTGQKNFRITFSKAFLAMHRADRTRPSVEITYRSRLLDTAGLNFAENVNHAELHYSNDPSDASAEHVEKKNTYHYTFGIDADIDAQANGEPGREETHEVNKVTESGGTYETVTKKTDPEIRTMRSPHPLAGAVFTLYSDEDCKNAVQRNDADYTAGSDENGHFSWTGLDEGTYYFKETAAPKRYTLSDAVYKVEITATLSEAGILDSYSIVTSRRSASAGDTDWKPAGTSTYTAAHTTNDDTGHVTNSTIQKEVTPMEVVDNRLRRLPNTGDKGIGSFILMAAVLGGCLAVFTTVVHIRRHA